MAQPDLNPVRNEIPHVRVDVDRDPNHSEVTENGFPGHFLTIDLERALSIDVELGNACRYGARVTTLDVAVRRDPSEGLVFEGRHVPEETYALPCVAEEGVFGLPALVALNCLHSLLVHEHELFGSAQPVVLLAMSSIQGKSELLEGTRQIEHVHGEMRLEKETRLATGGSFGQSLHGYL